MSAEVNAVCIIVFACGLGVVMRIHLTRISTAFHKVVERLDRLDDRLANVESLCVAQEKQREFDNRLNQTAGSPEGK